MRSGIAGTAGLPGTSQPSSVVYRILARLRACEGLPRCVPCLAGELGVSEQEIAAAARVPDLLGLERTVWWCYACGRKRDVVIAVAPSPSRRPHAA